MAEYIDREALAMRVLGLTIVDPMVASYADAVLLQIQQAPAADVVEVVRCKDCVYYEPCEGGKDYCCWHESAVVKNDFCSYEERKTNDSN